MNLEKLKAELREQTRATVGVTWAEFAIEEIKRLTAQVEELERSNGLLKAQLRATTYDVRCPECGRDWTIDPSREHGEHQCVCGCSFEWEAELEVRVEVAS